MKAILSFLAAMFIVGAVEAQVVKDQVVKADIESAVVYLTAAELTHTANLNLAEGAVRLRFTDISEKLNPQSIRVITNEEIDILSITSKVNYLTKNAELPRIKQLKDSLRVVSEQIQDLSDLKNAFATEKQLLIQNQKLGGENTGVTVAELKAASEFYRTRIAEINKEATKIDRNTAKLALTTERLNNELNELNAENLYARAEIEIVISAPRAIKTDLTLKYIVNSCGWSPSYDLKAVDTDKPVELTYQGRVFNNTGVDWKDIKVMLSTADPTRSVTKPKMNPWYLTQYSYANAYRGVSKGEGYTQNMYTGTLNGGTDFGNAVYDTDEEERTTNPGSDLGIVTDYAETAVPELSAEFDIVKRMTVPADDKPYPVDIAIHSLPATYKHYAVTKLDKDVFLLARIAGWQDLNMVDGPVNVYYSGTYLGQSFISTRDVKDTLDMSLGRDAKVLVTRTKLKEFSSTKIIGTKRRETMTYELVAKNNRKSDVEIDILDQIPISQTEEIKVKVLEITEVTPDAVTGEVLWNAKLKPGETKKYRISFQIEYPKDQQIEIIQNKQQSVRYKF